mgnify:FL=1
MDGVVFLRLLSQNYVSFLQSLVFNANISVYFRSTQFTCLRCGDFFLRKQTYNMHMKTHDNYACPLCKKTFSSKKRLQNHKLEEHSPKTESLVNNKDLNRVKATRVKQEYDESVSTMADQQQKNLKCRFCKFENLNYKKVARHERRHKKHRKFVCDQCGQAFNTEFNLREHTLYLHTDERNFKCVKCGKTFKAKNALIRHGKVGLIEI